MPKYTDKQIEEALRFTRGMKFLAAQRLGCSHMTIDARLAKSEHLRAVLAEEEGKLIDFGEQKLHEKVREGDAGMIKYLLSSKAKDRGYGERLDITSGGQPIAPLTVLLKEVTDAGSDPTDPA
jgi:hypothetical protein